MIPELTDDAAVKAHPVRLLLNDQSDCSEAFSDGAWVSLVIGDIRVTAPPVRKRQRCASEHGKFRVL